MGQNGKGTGMGVPNSPSADIAPPVKRQDLTHAGTGRERAKPVGLRRSENRPRPVERAESEPQGTLKGLRVKDGGRSEGRLVIRRIEVEPGACAVSTGERIHDLTRKWADFLPRSLVTREFGESL